MKRARAAFTAILERPNEQLWDYNAEDCEQTWSPAVALTNDAQYFHVEPAASRMLRIARPAHRMQERGLLVDSDRRAELKANVGLKLDERAAAILSLFEEHVGPEMRAAVHIGGMLRTFGQKRRKAVLKAGAFNPRSKQHLVLLFGRLGMQWKQTTPSGEKQLDLDVVMKLRRAFPKHDALLTQLWEYKKLEKLRADWLEDGKGQRLLCGDQRLRASVRVTGTQSGRFSEAAREWCVTCLQENHGRNRQNLPQTDDEFCNEHAPIRSMVIPGTGRAFVEVDYRSLEAWIGATLSGDPVFLARLRSGSVHVENARDIFGLPPTVDVKKDAPVQYRLAKIFLFGGVLYLGGPETIRSSYEEYGFVIPLADVKMQQARWKTRHQVFVQWQYRTIAQAALRRPASIMSALGRHRLFFGPSKEWGRDCLAHVISSPGADYVNEAFIELDAALPRDAGIALHLHDALLIDCAIEDVPEVVHHTVTAMEKDRGLGVFKVDVKWSTTNLHELHEYQAHA